MTSRKIPHALVPESKDYFYIGHRFVWSNIRLKRDLDGSCLKGFTARQMADSDCSEFSQQVTAGQEWAPGSITLMPLNPDCFLIARNLCNVFPTSKLQLCAQGIVNPVEIPLSNFWLEGEYVWRGHQTLPYRGIVLREGTYWDARIDFLTPKEGSGETSIHSFLAGLNAHEMFMKFGLRITIGMHVWGRP